VNGHDLPNTSMVIAIYTRNQIVFFSIFFIGRIKGDDSLAVSKMAKQVFY